MATLSAFITEVKADASEIEQDVVTGLKAGIDYVENTVTTVIEPELLTALQGALSAFGSSALAAFLGSLTPGATVTAPAAVTSTVS